MATCTFAVGTADDSDTPNTSGAFTPAVGDTLVVLVEAPGTLDAAPTCVGSTGPTFTLRKHQTWNGAAWSMYCFVSDTLVTSAVSQTVTVNCPSDVAVASIIGVYRVSGITRTGAAAVRQVGGTFGAAAVTPNFVLPGVALTGNPVLGVVGNNTNPAGLTPPASFTEPAGGDLGTTAPVTGAEFCHRDSGHTSTTVTWGSNSASAWGTAGIELDASAAAGITRQMMQYHG